MASTSESPSSPAAAKAAPPKPTPIPSLPTVARATAVYACLLFLCGFLFGTLRVLVLVPFLGIRIPHLIEAPLMAFAVWTTAVFIADDYSLGVDAGAVGKGNESRRKRLWRLVASVVVGAGATGMIVGFESVGRWARRELGGGEVMGLESEDSVARIVYRTLLAASTMAPAIVVWSESLSLVRGHSQLIRPPLSAETSLRGDHCGGGFVGAIRDGTELAVSFRFSSEREFASETETRSSQLEL